MWKEGAQNPPSSQLSSNRVHSRLVRGEGSERGEGRELLFSGAKDAHGTS